MNRLAPTLLGAVIVALFSVVLVHGQMKHGAAWTQDGYTYTIQMLNDIGMPYDQARAKAVTFYAHNTSLTTDPSYGKNFRTTYPEYWRLFTPRIVYAFIASRLWPHWGFYAMIIVSNIAYVIAVIGMYLLLLQITTPLVSGALAFAFGSVPDVMRLAVANYTDMLALAFWIILLIAIMRYTVSGKNLWLVPVIVLNGLMIFTRPMGFLPFTAGIGLLAAGILRHDRSAVVRGSFITVIAIAWLTALAFVAMHGGAPSFGALLSHYRGQSLVRLPLPIWYAARVAYGLVLLCYYELGLVFPLIAIAGMYLMRHRPFAPLLIGTTASLAVGLLLNPVSGTPTIARTVATPVLPILFCGVALAIAAYQQADRRQSTDRLNVAP